jgi:hypothetical protein
MTEGPPKLAALSLVITPMDLDLSRRRLLATAAGPGVAGPVPARTSQAGLQPPPAPRLAREAPADMGPGGHLPRFPTLPRLGAPGW